MELNYGQIENIFNHENYKPLLNKATGVFGLKLFRSISKLQDEMEPFRQQFQKIINKYSEKDKDGNPVVATHEGMQTVKILPGMEQEASAKINELREVNVKIDIEPIDFDDKNQQITAADLMAIKPLLK